MILTISLNEKVRSVAERAALSSAGESPAGGHLIDYPCQQANVGIFATLRWRCRASDRKTSVEMYDVSVFDKAAIEACSWAWISG